MCIDCWRENGAPSVWNEDVKKVVRLIYTVYEHDPVGNPLHVVLDDWNLDDCFIGIDEEDTEWLAQIPAQAVSAARELIPVFRKLSMEERYSVLAYVHGYLVLPEPLT